GVVRLLLWRAPLGRFVVVTGVVPCSVWDSAGFERNGGAERSAGIERGCQDAAHSDAARALGAHDPRPRGHAWIGADSGWFGLSRDLCQLTNWVIGVLDLIGISGGVHSIEESISGVHICGRVSGSNAGGAGLDSGARKAGSRDSDSFCHYVRLAVSAFSLDRMALSRGLCAGRNSHATGGGFRWKINGVANSGLFRSIDSGEPYAGGVGNGGTRVSGWRHPDGRGAVPCVNGDGVS